MIVDAIKNWRLYPFGQAWERSFGFLESLKPDMAEGRYEIDGDDIYAVVMSYSTRISAEAVYESHRKYTDIQAVLSGAEGFQWFPSSDLAIATPYDASSDVVFYAAPEIRLARIDIQPSRFITFFPDDAHMPTLLVGDYTQQIRKVVVKVRHDLLRVS